MRLQSPALHSRFLSASCMLVGTFTTRGTSSVSDASTPAGQVYTTRIVIANSASAFVFSFQTLKPGSAIAVSGTCMSLPLSAFISWQGHAPFPLPLYSLSLPIPRTRLMPRQRSPPTPPPRLSSDPNHQHRVAQSPFLEHPPPRFPNLTSFKAHPPFLSRWSFPMLPASQAKSIPQIRRPASSSRGRRWHLEVRRRFQGVRSRWLLPQQMW